MKKAVFLDRDGVINKVIFREGRLSTSYSLKEFEILPDVPQAIRHLKEKGFLCFVLTNQPELGEGKIPLVDLEAIHDFMLEKLEIDKVYFCPHFGEQKCNCQKPKPGMVIQATKEFSIDLSRSFVVGDRWRDIFLGKGIGCKTVLIPSKATAFDNKKLEPDYTAQNILDAARWIINNSKDVKY